MSKKKHYQRNRFSFFIAWRYFRAKRDKNMAHLIAWIGVLMVMTCTAALLIILSVFNGFQTLVEGLYHQFYTDMKITPRTGKTFVLTDSMTRVLQQHPGILAYAPLVETKVLAQSERHQVTALIRGVDARYAAICPLDDFLLEGVNPTSDSTKAQLLLGYGVASGLGIELSSGHFPLTLYFTNIHTQSKEIEREMHIGTFIPVGTFALQQKEIDNQYILLNRHYLLPYLGLADNEVSSVELRLKDRSEADAVKAALASDFPEDRFILQDYYEQNEELFMVLTSERRAIIIILTFILLIASFSISSGLVLAVMEKKKPIFLFRAMGLPTAYIQRIFLYYGFILGSLGFLLGLPVAGLVLWMQAQFHLIPLQGNHFMVDYFPVKVAAWDFMLTFLITIGISFVAAFLSAYRAKKMARRISFASL